MRRNRKNLIFSPYGKNKKIILLIMEPLPFQIINQMIQCFGKCFHYKDVLESFLISSGIDHDLVKKYKDEPKFIWGRKLLTELNTSDEGILSLRKILTSYNNLKNIPDINVFDKDSGLSALRELKEMIVENNIIVKEEKGKVINRKIIAEEKARIIIARQEKLF
jgi:hypothetical protein